MKKMKLILTLLIGLTILSCSSDDDNNNTTSQFQGDWSGTFTGDEDNGSWNATVNGNGEINGTVTSDVFSVSWDATGMVQDNGNVNISAGSATSGATFIGTMNSSSANGTWENTIENMNGTWTGNKN